MHVHNGRVLASPDPCGTAADYPGHVLQPSGAWDEEDLEGPRDAGVHHLHQAYCE